MTMEWRKDGTDERYTLQASGCEAMVWHTVAGAWAYLIVGLDMEEGRDDFPTAEDAQAACLTQLAELRRQGGCGE